MAPIVNLIARFVVCDPDLGRIFLFRSRSRSRLLKRDHGRDRAIERLRSSQHCLFYTAFYHFFPNGLNRRADRRKSIDKRIFAISAYEQTSYLLLVPLPRPGIF